MGKVEDALTRLVVDSSGGSLRRVIHLNGLVLHADGAISSLNTVNNNSAIALVSGVTDRFLFLEDEYTWLVIIQDGNTGAGIIALESLAFSIVQLNVEVLIRLPLVIV